MTFATIATVEFRPELERLLESLRRIHPDAEVRVYVLDPGAFAGLPGSPSLVAHPKIGELGVKRSKFDLYRREMERGPFVFLDCDIIVLGDLSELLAGICLNGCPDDMSACPFIPDRLRPWPGDPSLVCETYVNSGVLGFGPAMARWVGQMAEQAENQTIWSRYILPGLLYDNHFLCAQINLLKIDLTPHAATRFNWQGIRNADRSLAAHRSGDRIVHTATGEILHLIHFAGERDVDAAIFSLPVEMAELLNRVSRPPARRSRALSMLWGSLAGAGDSDDPQRPAIARLLCREMAGLLDGAARADSYLADPTSVVSAALSCPPSPIRWNGLQCGGAYLTPDEYVYLRTVLREVRPVIAVEVGAGETSSLIQASAERAVSIEAHEGPWAERARVRGADVRIVPFSDGFDTDRLRAALAGIAEIDLLFLDSPVGGHARAIALRQLLECCPIRHVVAHDARRDTLDLLHVLVGRGYQLGDVGASRRGFLVMTRLGEPPICLPEMPFAPLTQHRARIEIADEQIRLSGKIPASVMVRVANDSSQQWTNVGPNPVRLAYRLKRNGSVVVGDGRRTEFPAIVSPGDDILLPMRIDAMGLPAGDYDIEITLVEEGRAWFESPVVRRVRVSES